METTPYGLRTTDYGVKLMDPSEAFVRPTYHLVPAKAINKQIHFKGAQDKSFQGISDQSHKAVKP